ncbi:cbb3-type cytochrome c oxidase subunit I [Ilumatobacter sp.]|uniref:cbb3-type cytochrome c oxidase subunit I n=1 Tax=Ilumatobacter sp. TaxID=1967498 RepID=UPI003AF5C3C3
MTVDDDASSGSAIVSFFVGIGAWVVTVDHKRIGRLYLGFGMLGLAAASVLGLLLGIERADDADTLLQSNALLQLFQSYRVSLVFAAILPLAIGLSVAAVPLQLGARSIAFPRVALTGFYAWLGGLALTMAALGANGGIGGGDDDAVDLFLAGHGLMIVGLLASAGCVATSVLTTRAPGMTMRRVPLFSWSALIGALGSLLVLPVAFGVIVLLFLDHRYAQLNFGGAEGIAAWIGWLFSVPAVVAFALPAVGVAAELVPVTFKARQAMRGAAFAGIALIGITALAATTQQFVFDVTFDTSGREFFDDVVPMLIFTGLPLLGMLMVMGLGALTAKNGVAGGRPAITAPFVFSFLGLGMILVGLLGNLVLNINDLELAGTTFEEGATLYVVYGGALSVMGGVAFWAPKWWGRTMSDAALLPLALLGVVGTILAALPLYVAGFLDQTGGIPANDADVAAILSLDGVDGGATWIILSLVGHGLVALTLVGFVGLMVATFTGRGEPADENPYGAHTIEWSTPSPAPADNYEHVATVASATPQFDLTHEGSQS